MRTECIFCKKYHTFRCPENGLADPKGYNCLEREYNPNKKELEEQFYSSTGYIL